MLKGAGEKITLEICQMYYYLGFNCVWTDGKDLTIVKKEEPSDCSLKSSRVKQNIL